MSEENQNQTAGVTPTETLEQERDANAQGVDKDGTQKIDEEKINQLMKESEENRKEVETARRRIAELNKDDTSKRLKIDKLKEIVKATEERDALLQKELETLRQQNSEKEKGFAELETRLKTLEEQQLNAKVVALKQEEERKVELIKQAELISKKQNDPEILTLVESAKNNATREIILNKLKVKKVDTVKVTGLSSFGNIGEKNINLVTSSLTDLSRLKDDDPELYEDILNKAQKWSK
jgi:septal ring factor EnvC (AmiA/AmiB activator)